MQYTPAKRPSGKAAEDRGSASVKRQSKLNKNYSNNERHNINAIHYSEAAERQSGKAGKRQNGKTNERNFDTKPHCA